MAGETEARASPTRWELAQIPFPSLTLSWDDQCICLCMLKGNPTVKCHCHIFKVSFYSKGGKKNLPFSTGTRWAGTRCQAGSFCTDLGPEIPDGGGGSEVSKMGFTCHPRQGWQWEPCVQWAPAEGFPRGPRSWRERWDFVRETANTLSLNTRSPLPPACLSYRI